MAESDRDRLRRHHDRTLFDGAADRYDAYRLGYADEIVEFAVAGLTPDSTVLEVACGTGQLTERLAGFGFHLTAIDIGPSMVAAARRRLAGAPVVFDVGAFEDFAAPDHSFDLIVSGSAFHWIDPEVKFTKPARLLRPGGWLALLGSTESYDPSLEKALHDMWVERSDYWRSLPPETTLFAESGLFAAPVVRVHEERLVRSVDAVVGVENTRATSLSWSPDVRAGFTDSLRHFLRSRTEVEVTHRTSLTMARVL